MRKNFGITLAVLACESWAVKIESAGFFDNLMAGANAVAGMTGN